MTVVDKSLYVDLRTDSLQWWYIRRKDKLRIKEQTKTKKLLLRFSEVKQYISFQILKRKCKQAKKVLEMSLKK